MTLKEACETALAIEQDGRMLVIEIRRMSQFPIAYPSAYDVECMTLEPVFSERSTLNLSVRPENLSYTIARHIAYFRDVRAKKAEHDDETPA